MKFGKHLDDNRRDEWEQNYLDYKSLKDLIKESAQEQEENGRFGTAYSPRVTSLSVLRADRVQTADERFFQKLDTEVRKAARAGHLCDKVCSSEAAMLERRQVMSAACRSRK